MIINTKLEYDTVNFMWILTVKASSKEYIGETRQKAIEACLSQMKPEDTIRITNAV